MADIRKFPSKHLDKLRLGYRDFVKKGAYLKDWQKLTKDLSPEDMDFMHDLRDVDFPNLRGNPMNRPETSGGDPSNWELLDVSPMGAKDQADFDVAMRRRKQLKTPQGKPYIIRGDAIQSPPKSKLRSVDSGKTYSNIPEAPKVSKRGFKWGTAARIAGKAAWGVGAVTGLLEPPINFDTGKVRRHPVYDRMSRNINKVTLGIK